MASPDTFLAQGSQYVKEVYAPRVTRIYPEANFLVKNIPFNAANRVGKQYVVPIELAPEQGVTYAAPSAGAFSLVGAVALSTQDAILSPSQIVVQRAVDYESIQRTVGSKAAFVSMIDATLRSVVALATKRLELSMLYGQHANGIGVVSSVTGAGTGAGATRVLTIVAAEWSGGLWGGLENALVDVWQPAFAGIRNVSLNLKVQSVDLVNQTVTVQNIASDAGLGNIAPNDVIVFGGTVAAGPVFNEMAGLFQIASNTGALFNINAASYGLWKGNSITSWGAPSLGKILDGVSKLIERGLDEDVVFLCSPKHFSRLNSDQTALRLYDSSYKSSEATNGFNQLRFASENGAILVRSHRFVKDGYCVALPLSKLMRVGSTELTFTNMGVDGDIFIQTPNQASVELRGYLGQALLGLAPSRLFLGSGVTYP